MILLKKILILKKMILLKKIYSFEKLYSNFEKKNPERTEEELQCSMELIVFVQLIIKSFLRNIFRFQEMGSH